MFGLSPYLLIGAILGIIGAFGAGFYAGDDTAATRYQLKISALQAQAAEDAQVAAQAMLIKVSNAAEALETGNAKARVIYRTITRMVDKIVDRPIYSGTCFDDDGLRLANLALAGISVSSTNPGQPQGPVPETITPQ